eukprot:g4130.t1
MHKGVARNYATTVVLALLYHAIYVAVVELPLLVDASAAAAAPRDPDHVAAGEEGDGSNTKRPPGFLSSAGVQVSVKYLSGGDLFEFSLPGSEVATATAGHVTAAYAHRYPGSWAHLVLVSAVQRGAGGGDAGAGPEAEDRSCVVLPLAPQAVLRELPRLQWGEAEEPRSWVFQGVLQPLVGFTFAKWGRLAPFDAKEWHAPDPVGGFRLLSELGGDGLLAFQQLPIHQLAKDFEWALFRGGRTAQPMPGPMEQMPIEKVLEDFVGAVEGRSEQLASPPGGGSELFREKRHHHATAAELRRNAPRSLSFARNGENNIRDSLSALPNVIDDARKWRLFSVRTDREDFPGQALRQLHHQDDDFVLPRNVHYECLLPDYTLLSDAWARMVREYHELLALIPGTRNERELPENRLWRGRDDLPFIASGPSYRLELHFAPEDHLLDYEYECSSPFR